MLPTLLWRCPLCATDDALEQLVRPLRGDLVRCRACRAEWRLRRVPGDDFYLRLIRGGPRPPRQVEDSGIPNLPRQVEDSGVPNLFGKTASAERSVAAWYDAMKATVRLAPLHDPALALYPGETLYLASGPATLQAEETDPRFFPVPESATADRADKRAMQGRMVGAGRLFLTDRRLVWQGKTACDFPLVRLNSAYALLADGLVLMVELRLVTVRFLQESLLKWVTHIALVAPQVAAATGHRIATAHF